MELSRRELSVLCGIVDIYVRTGEPVASRQVARSPGLSLSSATIRNVVAGLEEAGLVRRPHPSAGCVPTDRGLRAYVDSLGERLTLGSTTRQRVAEVVNLRRRELFEDFEWVARVVAEVTTEAGMAVRPIAAEPTVAAISFVPLEGDRALGVMVTTDGAIEKRVLSLPPGVDEPALVEAENWAAHRLRGSSIDVIRDELGRGSGDDAPGFERLARTLLEDLLSGAGDAVELLVVGTDTLLMSSDFSEIDRVRSVLRTLADGGRIVREWRRGFRRSRTHVVIGDESDVTASGGLGMVATLFYRDGRRAGALGVVGPRRMDYRRIVPTVELIGETLTRMLNGSGATHAG